MVRDWVTVQISSATDHPRSVAYSAEQVIRNKQQIWCGGAYLDCYQRLNTVLLATRRASYYSPPTGFCCNMFWKLAKKMNPENSHQMIVYVKFCVRFFLCSQTTGKINVDSDIHNTI